MYCIECATELPDHAKFCHSCAAPQPQRLSAIAVADEGIVLPPAANDETLQEEVIFLDQGGGVKVTSTRFIVPTQVFAMSGVTSVRFACMPAKKGSALAICLFGALCLVNPGTRLLGLLLIVLGGLWLYGPKDEYAVFLTVASGEVRAISSKNEQSIREIVKALNEAIRYRR